MERGGAVELRNFSASFSWESAAGGGNEQQDEVWLLDSFNESQRPGCRDHWVVESGSRCPSACRQRAVLIRRHFRCEYGKIRSAGPYLGYD